MFDSVDKKFVRAEYFLKRLTEEQVGGHPWRAYLDAFFFELVSTKDFFLQAINDKYNLGLKRDDATKFSLLKRCLICNGHVEALGVIKQLEGKLSDPKSWLWCLNNYRNCATHRELLHLDYEVGKSDHVEIYLFKDPEDRNKGNADTEVITYCQKSFKDLKAYLEKLFNEIK